MATVRDLGIMMTFYSVILVY